jgi:hypothetical protein
MRPSSEGAGATLKRGRRCDPRERAQGMPGARCARSLACKIESTRVSHHGHTGSPGIPRAMVLTVSFVLSPVIGLVCHRHRRDAKHHHHLTPASRRQDHTTSPSASSAVVIGTISVHRIPLHVRDDRETPLVEERDGGVVRGDLGKQRSGISFKRTLDGANHLDPSR